MVDTFTFLHREWLWVALICGMTIWLVFLWKERGLSGWKIFLLKAFVALLAVISLIVIAVQPMQERAAVKGLGILLTEGYDASDLDSLQNAHKKIAMVPYKENTVLEKALDSISTVYVLGNGIATYDFWQLENRGVHYLVGETPSGIVRLAYDPQLSLGESLVVQGLYQLPSQKGKIILQDAGGNALDSITIVGGESQRFKMGTPLSVAGKYVYKLVEKDSLGEVLRENPIPVVVKTADVLDILIVNDSPTFETKYLKNFLAESGHRVLVRSQLTKDRFKFENFNRAQGAVYGLSKKNLEAFDLVILNGNSYLSLSSSSKRAVQRAMEEDGLGVFIQPEDQVFEASLRASDFRFKRNKRESSRLYHWPKIPIQTYEYSFASDVLLLATLKSEDDTVAGYRQKGAGRLGTSVLQDTYELVLEGHQEAYNYVWSSILTGIAKRETVTTEWDSERIYAYQDEPFYFRLRTAVAQPEVIANRTYRVPLQGYVDMEDLWSGVVYPKNTGWNTLGIIQDSTAGFDYYSMDTRAWKAMARYNRIQENRRFFQQPIHKNQKVLSEQPINLLLFFVVFVLAMGFLWLEPRLRQSL